MANRNILLLYWLGAPILAVSLQRGLAAVRLPRALVPAAVACVAVAVVATRHGRLTEPAPFRVPEVSVAELADLTGGNVFCSVRYGGYIAWRLHPDWSPYIDGRLVLRTREQFAEYLGVLDHPERFDELRARHDFSAAVLPTAFPGRYLPLVAYLIEHPSWSLLYTDGTEISLVYDPTGGREVSLDARAAEEALVARARTEVERSAGYRNLLRLLLTLGDTRHAGRLLSRRSDDPDLQGLVARFHYLEGDLDLAQLHAERRLATEEDDIDSLNLLALIAVERGRQKEALGHLRRSLELDPYGPEALELVRRMEEIP
jgi:tetratricopeptide (TPR) repeat protein